MIIELRPSFACHFDIICSSSVLPSSLNGIVPFGSQKGYITLAASILIGHDAILRSVLDGLSAMGMCHGIVSRIATLPDRHNKFSNLLHVIFPSKPHHFSAAKVVCGAHFVYGLQGVLRIGQ